MRTHHGKARLIAAALLLSAGSAALGQQARFVQPAAATVPVGGEVSLSLEASDAAQSWADAPADYFLARTAWTQENRDAVSVAEGAGGLVAAWPATEPGVLMFGVDFAPRGESVTSESFAAFVRRVLPAKRQHEINTMLDTAKAQDAGEVTLHRVESCKALVRVESAGDAPVSIATSKTGQAVEIRPLMDPTTIALGSDLAVRVYSRIPGPRDGLVIATNVTTGEVVRAPTNDTSLAIIPIEHAGRWRLEFHAVEPAEPQPQGDEQDAADWTVHTATLTFEVGDVAAGEEATR